MSTSERFKQVMRRWAELFMHHSLHEFKRFMDESGLSASQVHTLMQLYRQGDCGVARIGNHLGVTSAAASQMVDRLVEYGLLERGQHAGDRRTRPISLTPKGRALVEAGIEARRGWMEQLTRSFSLQEQELIICALTLLSDAAAELEPAAQPAENIKFTAESAE